MDCEPSHSWLCRTCFGANERLRSACYRCGGPQHVKAPAGYCFLRAEVSGLPTIVVNASLKRPRQIQQLEPASARRGTIVQTNNSPAMRKTLDLSLLSKIQPSSIRVEPAARKRPRIVSSSRSSSSNSRSTDSDGSCASSIDSDQQVMRAIRKAAAAAHVLPKQSVVKVASPQPTVPVEAERIIRVSRVLPKGAKPAGEALAATRADGMDNADARVAVLETVRAEYRDSAIRLMVGAILSSYTKSNAAKDVTLAGERVLTLVELMEKGLHSLLVNKPLERTGHDTSRLPLYQQTYSAQIRRIVQVLRDPKSIELCLAIVDETEDASTFARAIFQKAGQLAARENENRKTAPLRAIASIASVSPVAAASATMQAKEAIKVKRAPRLKQPSAPIVEKAMITSPHASAYMPSHVNVRPIAPRAPARKEPASVKPSPELARPMSAERPYKRRLSQYLTRKAEMADLEKWDPAEGETFPPPDQQSSEQVILQPGTSSPLANVYIPGLGVEADAAMNEFLRAFEFAGTASLAPFGDGNDGSSVEAADPFSALIASMEAPTDASQLASVMQEFLADMRTESPNSLASDP